MGQIQDFLGQISVHLARQAKCTEILSKQVLVLFHLGPIQPNLAPVSNTTPQTVQINAVDRD